MIQRIQTIYLLVVALLNGVLPLLFPIYTINNVDVFATEQLLFLGLFGISVLLALIAIFLFKNRKQQFVFNRINILCNLILLGVLVYQILNSSGENSISVKGVLMFVPLISVVFLFLANKAIRRDENLVKSVDRLR